MSKYFIGLMTGTSADSIDGCVVDFSNGFELIHSKSNDLEKNYKAKYEEAIKKGFTNSIGCILGNTNKSIHLLEPLISTPIIGTRNNKTNDKQKNISEIL